MRQSETKRVNRDQYDAVLFDLDGVITNTATLHATCWKQMFDEYLRKRAEQRGEAFRTFDLSADYQLYVDGKPRFDGARDFLRSRGSTSPRETRTTPVSVETVHGLGNRKNDLLNRAMARTWWLKIWPNWSTDRRPAPHWEKLPMLHHERLRPPSRDYPADEWNVVEKAFHPNSWHSSKRCWRSATAIWACADARRKAGPVPRMALSSMGSMKLARSSTEKTLMASQGLARRSAM